MKKLKLFVALALMTAACDGEANADRAALEGRNDIQQVAEDDPVMNAAISQAKKSLPQFLAVLKQTGAKPDDIGFKYPLGGWEHIWVGDVKMEDGVLVGTLSNEPAQEAFKMGQEVRVPINQVSDWAYRDSNGVMQGHYTTKVLLPQLDPQEAASIRESFGW
jgi:uncharacterized protein YegJ (DUF2314 family)